MEKKQLFEEAVRGVVHFDNDILMQGVAASLARGNQVIVEVELYRGNGKWKLDKYRYKMFVPVFDKHGGIYSTDVFETIKGAHDGEYGIYHATRQNVTKLISYSTPADLSPERYGHGYTEEDYGHFSADQYLEKVSLNQP